MESIVKQITRVQEVMLETPVYMHYTQTLCLLAISMVCFIQNFLLEKLVFRVHTTAFSLLPNR